MENKEKLLNILNEKTNINPSNYKLEENQFLKIDAAIKISNVHFHKLNGTFQIQFQPANLIEKAVVIELFVSIFSFLSIESPSIFKDKLEKEKFVNFDTLNIVDVSLKKDDNVYTIVYFE